MEEERVDRKGSIVVGVCSMAKKTQGKPMQAILKLMKQYYGGLLEIIFFPEKTILNESVDKWPIVDCFVCFHATGFPLDKAIKYCKMHPDVFVLNEPSKQYDLLDRTRVYRTLEKSGIETPRHAVLRRDQSLGMGKLYMEELETDELMQTDLDTPLVEGQDHIEVGGYVFNKPFVEKPISAEDHNIYIYYPSASGGGSHRLFRKVGDRSSEYSSVSRVRTEGSYIYENFLPTDGTDCKVYAVGPDYAHAEARKSPALDGKVERDSEGKEVRYPVILTNKEKLIARKVVLAFKQTVCGFDLLRANGNSYVCDVNGFSFVKTSKKYYEDSARILGNMILRKLAERLHVPWTPAYQPDGPAIVTTTLGKPMELRCILGVIRHGDRTPKQKMKMEVKDKRFMELFKLHHGFKTGDLKLKRPKQLQEVLDLARTLLKESRQEFSNLRQEYRLLTEGDSVTGEKNLNGPNELKGVEKRMELMEEEVRKWDQLRGVLEMYGHFAGINRKIQLKYLANGSSRKSSESESEQRSPSLLLVLKWGGELTPAGRRQAQSLGHLFRTLYPGIEEDEEEGKDTQGLGFLRLHSTYRHDLKIYASDEGRVQMTAAAFAKGLLALEGDELAPIVSQLVKSANTDGLLDDDTDARKYQSEMKKCLHEYLTQDRELTQEDHVHLNPLESKAIRAALNQIKNPGKMCQDIYNRLYSICESLAKKRKKYGSSGRLYMGETWELVERRWSKLLRDFRRSDRKEKHGFDISKIPDIYDNVRYDLQHNPIFYNFDSSISLYEQVKLMAEVVVPQEYGIKKPQKLSIAQGICIPLMKKLRVDLQRCIEGSAEDDNLTRLDPRASQGIATPFRHVRTRLYFTSESHIHSMINLLRFGGLIESAGEEKEWERAKHYLSIIAEFNYMSQIVLLMYEDTTKDVRSPDRFHIELAFSPGLFPLFTRPNFGMGRSYGKYRATRGSKDSKDKMQDSSSEIQGESLTGEEIVETDEVEELQLAECDVVSLRDLMIQRPTNEQLAKHSPPGTPRETDDVNKPYPVLKSLSEVAVTQGLVEAPTSPEEEKEETEKGVWGLGRRRRPPTGTRRPYATRHHTVNFHPEGNKLLSTAVISGLLPSTKDAKKELSVVGGEMLVRGASAPDLKNCSMEESSGRLPPLFSLETLHNQLSHKMMDEFLEKITTIRTPIPSPPKTPQVKISRENSNLSGETPKVALPSKTIEAVSERLHRLHQNP